MRINKNLISSVFLSCAFIGISSCYTYGPTHKPYGYRIKTKEYKANYINKAYEEAKTEISEGTIEHINETIKILFPNHINYHSNETIPSLEFALPLKKLAFLLKKYPETNILITGHTDNTGTEEYNKKIARKRADFIKKYLVEQGVMSSRIESWGLGSVSPIESNNTQEGKAKNRRVEFVILYDDK